MLSMGPWDDTKSLPLGFIIYLGRAAETKIRFMDKAQWQRRIFILRMKNKKIILKHLKFFFIYKSYYYFLIKKNIISSFI